MWRFCVFLAVVVAVTVAEDCADFASFNIQILGKTKVRKPDVMESLQKVRTIILGLLMCGNSKHEICTNTCEREVVVHLVELLEKLSTKIDLPL